MITSMVNATGFYVPLYSLMYFASALALLVLISVPASASPISGTDYDTNFYYWLQTQKGQHLTCVEYRKLEITQKAMGSRRLWNFIPDGSGAYWLSCLWEGTQLAIGHDSNGNLKMVGRDAAARWRFKGGPNFRYFQLASDRYFRMNLATMKISDRRKDIVVNTIITQKRQIHPEYVLSEQFSGLVLQATRQNASRKPRTDKDDQKWMFIRNNDGSYHLVSTYYGRRISLASTERGLRMIDYHRTNNQLKWILEFPGFIDPEELYIKNKQTGRYVLGRYYLWKRNLIPRP